MKRYNSEFYKEFKRYYAALKIFRFFCGHLYVYSCIFKDLFRKKTGLERQYHHPRNIVLKLHDLCNARCTFCYARKEDAAENSGSVTIDEWKDIIDQAASIGCYTVTFSGGEPLIYPGIYELIAYSRKKKMLSFMSTNGIALTSESAKRLEQSGLCALNFSILGPGAYHDNATGIKGSYESIVKNSTVAIQSTKIICIVNHVLTNESAQKHWPDLIWKDMKSLGFRALSILPLCLSGSSDAGLLDENSIRYLDELARRDYVLMDTKNYSQVMCPAAREDLLVNNFGDVQPCPFIPISFGNVRNNSLKSIFMRMQKHPMFRPRRNVCMPARDRQFIAEYLMPVFRKGNLPVCINELEKILKNAG